ncbi:MAG: sulfatase-like hydrolase/transferase [Pirellulaceae bacterium]
MRMRLLALWLLGALGTCGASAAERPNILVIVADDLGYADLGAYRGAEVATPHLDALAASGIRCTSAYVTAPYCSPSRAGLLTGISATRFGHEFNPHVGEEATLGLPLNQRTLADELGGAGYATALMGKWHLGFSSAHHPLSRGFHSFVGFLVGGHNFLLHADAAPRFGSAHSHDMIYRDRELQRLDGYTTDLFTDEAIRFMDARGAEQPWFVCLTYNAVHTPLEMRSEHLTRIPASVSDPARRGYLSLLLGLDDAIGRLIEHLRSTGKLNNTLVFFFSDNGGSGHKPFLAYNTGRNAPLRGDKGQTLEGGIRVPFLIAWPGVVPPGGVFHDPVWTLDVLATACAAAGTKPRASVEGVNLLPYLTGAATVPADRQLAWRFGPQRAIRQGDWKLVDWRDFESKQQSGWQLYNLATDVGEQHDLASLHPDRVQQLRKAWDEWNAKNVEPLWRGSPTEDPLSIVAR